MIDTDFNFFKENATFIVGHPRSGTSLLRTLFDHHPNLVVFPVESHFFDWVDSKKKVEAFFKRTSFEAHCKRSFSADIEDLKDRLRIKFGKQGSKKDILLSLIEMYYAIEESDKKDKRRWMEKTPSHISSIPILKKWFGQNIKVICIYRDPRDVFVSIKKKYPSTSISDFCLSYNNYYKMHFFFQKKYSDWFFPVKYEQLLENPEEILKELCWFLRIEFNKCLLQPTINGKAYPGNSRFGEKLFSLSKSPIGRYVHYLSRGEANQIETYLNKVMKHYGYNINHNKILIRRKEYYIFMLRQSIRLLKDRVKWCLSALTE